MIVSGNVKIRRDKNGWPLCWCKKGHEMLWIGLSFFFCPSCKAGPPEGQIFCVVKEKGAS
jgi:hypothetical protein